MKLVILDRDGVINEDSDDYIKSEEEWRAIPGSLNAIARLSHAGYKIVVASNQSGLARGLFDINALNAIHKKMNRHLEQFGGNIDAIFFCPHHPDDNCPCRKLRPGLLHEISRRLRLPLYKSIVVGDKLADVEAAQSVKARAILVRTGKGAAIVDNDELPENVEVYDDLASFVDILLRRD